MTLYNLIAAKAVMNGMDRSAERDKRLRDAAPDLLEALTGLIYGDEITKDRARHKGIAAIAKATGQ